MTKIPLYLMSILSVMILLSGCKKDDPAPEINYGEKIAGTYKGEMSYQSTGASSTKTTRFSIIQAGVNKIGITVKDYQFNDATSADLTFLAVAVTGSQDGQSLVYNGSNGVSVGGATVKATVTGTSGKDGSNMSLVFEVEGSNRGTITAEHYENKTAAAVTAVDFKGICVVSTEIDEAGSVIKYSVPSNVRDADLAKIIPTFTVSEGATYAPAVIDITKADAKITVTSEDGAVTKVYAIKREIAKVEDMSLKVINNYSGSLTVTVDNTPITTEQLIYITRMSENAVKLKIKDFAFGGQVIGDIVVDSIALYPHKDTTNLSGFENLTFKLGTTEIEAQADVQGLFTESTKTVDLKIKISGIAGMVIAVDFNGIPGSSPKEVQPIFVSVKGDGIISQTFEDKGNLTFYVYKATTNEQLSKITYDIQLPIGATWTPYNNVPFDFTKQVNYYDVVAADKTTKKRFSITKKVIEPVNTKAFDFTKWKTTIQQAPLTSNSDPEGWQTPNSAVVTIKAFTNGEFYPNDGMYPVEPVENGKVGKAAQLTTLDTKGGLILGMIDAPKVTSGTIYTGAFDMWAAMENPLLATKFGLHYNGPKVTALKGWYTYAPGAVYFDVKTEVPGLKDQPSISAVLYDVTDNVNASLTGVDIYTSPRVVATATINPAVSADFKEFELTLNYNAEYAPLTKVYKLAIIMSASKDGAQFKGAPGSTFVIDEVQLVTE